MLFYVIFRFSLAAFNNFSLSLIFANFITMCLGMFLLGFILYGTLCASWTWVAISFPRLGNSSAIMSSNIFSAPFSLFFFWDPYNAHTVVLDVVPEVF